jgi:bifunctional DNase/RNase
MEKVAVEILGLSTSPGNSGAYALILKESEGNRRLPIIIGPWEAQCIALELEGIRPPRPLTHDLLKSIIDALGRTVTEIYISELRDGTFYAKIIIEGIGGEIDARPSDAIAVAVRYRAKIYIDESVMSQAAFLPENEGDDLGLERPDEPDEDDESTPEPQKSAPLAAVPATESERIKLELRDAIALEDYERAAQLRDKLNNLGA